MREVGGLDPAVAGCGSTAVGDGGVGAQVGGWEAAVVGCGCRGVGDGGP